MIILKKYSLTLVGFLLFLTACSSTPEYPSSLSDKVINLTAKDGRNIDVRVLLSQPCNACPLIIFSHGANAAYDRYDRLLRPLAKKGYRIAAPNHVDSEEHPHRADYTPADSLPKRIEDYELIVDHFKPTTLIAVGHSYGALIAQIAAGAELAGESGKVKVNSAFRPKTIVALSPPGAIPGYIEKAGLAKITTPTLVVTGTQDVVPNFADKWQVHLDSYDAAPTGLGYALIYDDMNHYMNGAYGRETDDITTERTRAMVHLLAATSIFIDSTIKNTTVSNWLDQSQEFVEARAN